MFLCHVYHTNKYFLSDLIFLLSKVNYLLESWKFVIYNFTNIHHVTLTLWQGPPQDLEAHGIASWAKGEIDVAFSPHIGKLFLYHLD